MGTKRYSVVLNEQLQLGQKYIMQNHKASWYQAESMNSLTIKHTYWILLC